ncbi:conserved hypothetical protein [Clavispora lusitaniae ATCC 42720]|uniref:Uncharacterized protein n=1 Tax=Clavispora lusitaniae (strain ATCC 42720) TaxID=306902 RepID=C4YCE5_CLAL4|nr:uncharacterized protein CLUG_05784 [Clavispora lusitaniae ATCC 42720]EEQ41655.1 conserved hypothetical protein [Clavispora lusitaniae ATCC 42720]
MAASGSLETKLGNTNGNWFHNLVAHQGWCNLAHTLAHGVQVVVWQWRTQVLGQGTHDLPVFTSGTWGICGGTGDSCTAFSVHIRSRLFCVSRTRQNHVSQSGTSITMVASVHDKGVFGDVASSNLISSKQVHELRRRRVVALETEVQCGHTSSFTVQHIDTVPFFTSEVVVLGGKLSHGLVDGFSIWRSSHTRANDNHRAFSTSQLLAVGASQSGGQVLGRDTQASHVEGRVELSANVSDFEVQTQPHLTDTSIQHSSFMTRVGTHKQDSVSILNAVNGRAEYVVRTHVHAAKGNLLHVCGGVFRAQTVSKVFKSSHRLSVSQSTGNGTEFTAAWSKLVVGCSHGCQGIVPGRRLKTVAVAHQRRGQTLGLESIACKPRLVRDPLLVDVIVDTGHHTHHLGTTGVHTDVGTESIHDVNGLCAFQLPWTGLECIWLRGQCSHRTQVDDVSRQFGVDVALDVGADSHVVTTASSTKFWSTRNIVHEPHAPRAVDTSIHQRLDQRSNSLVFNGTLSGHLHETATVGPVPSRSLLQVTLTTSVTNRTIQRMVSQQHLGNTLARLGDTLTGGVHHHAILHGHCTRCNQLGHALDIDETHTTVTSNGQLVVVAVARNGDAGLFRSSDDGRASLDQHGLTIHCDLHVRPAAGRHAKVSRSGSEHGKKCGEKFVVEMRMVNANGAAVIGCSHARTHRQTGTRQRQTSASTI